MLILAMAFSCTVVFLAILLSAALGRKVLSSAWVYSMLRINLIFFCFPLHLYNSEYKNRLFNILGIPRQWGAINMTTDNVIGIEKGGRIYLNFQTYLILAWLIWACGLLFMFFKNIYKYNKVKSQKLNPQVSQSNYLEIFDNVRKELGIKKSVDLLSTNESETVCTIGIFRKYIIIPERGMTDEEVYYSLKHELIHVKRADVAWRYIALLAVLINWFNLLVYFYFYIMSIYCEQSCDAILVQNLDKTARKRYGELIIDMSQVDGAGKWKRQMHLGGSRRIIKWRLTNMLEVRKRKRFHEAASLLLSAVILFGGSLTVCAYEEPVVISGETALVVAYPDQEVIKTFVAGEMHFSEEEVLDYTKFLGDDGTCYDLSGMPDDNMEKAGCIHSFVGGYIADHHKNLDGSCRTDYYYAEQCSKCGRVESKGYAYVGTSSKCTH